MISRSPSPIGMLASPPRPTRGCLLFALAVIGSIALLRGVSWFLFLPPPVHAVNTPGFSPIAARLLGTDFAPLPQLPVPSGAVHADLTACEGAPFSSEVRGGEVRIHFLIAASVVSRLQFRCEGMRPPTLHFLIPVTGIHQGEVWVRFDEHIQRWFQPDQTIPLH